MLLTPVHEPGPTHLFDCGSARGGCADCRRVAVAAQQPHSFTLGKATVTSESPEQARSDWPPAAYLDRDRDPRRRDPCRADADQSPEIEASGKASAAYFARAVADFSGRPAHGLRVLDFGCGAGHCVQALLDLGIDAYGADIDGDWTMDRVAARDRIGTIGMAPYRLPFPDDHFDAVISSTVLEHAVNKEELLREIRRILKPGGWSMHVLPSKWYLPLEPHIQVPLVNILWPHVPRWWLALWALLGIRMPSQRGMSWREVRDWNANYVEHGLHYWRPARLADACRRIFGNYRAPAGYFAANSHGRAAAILNRLPGLGPWLFSTFRMTFIVSQKPER